METAPTCNPRAGIGRRLSARIADTFAGFALAHLPESLPDENGRIRANLPGSSETKREEPPRYDLHRNI